MIPLGTPRPCPRTAPSSWPSQHATIGHVRPARHAAGDGGLIRTGTADLIGLAVVEREDPGQARKSLDLGRGTQARGLPADAPDTTVTPTPLEQGADVTVTVSPRCELRLLLEDPERGAPELVGVRHVFGMDRQNPGETGQVGDLSCGRGMSVGKPLAG